ncbi:hypothetical protein PACTADRAFT_51249 [Pachysolen tannophilus NRRL Y-2460]|uniref:Class II aldolase/adducin N-terminal domain-containing protein n=1 Tax=Pachysolen tannophilus NRRL Y-2460 TaxID=669874 RepID=A0A1E4TRP0_PACTA|nr:hypothetical protein PACTADRAFT_51249 [Pachysolen tannophilus NRRL Y-2460]
MSSSVVETANVSVPSSVEASTSRGYKLGKPGSHNLALGDSHPHKIPKFSDPYEKRKWVLQHMAGAFRIFARKGYTEGAAGHISVRDPVDPDTFWINPLAKHFGLIKASDLVQVDSNGNIIGGSKKAINAAGFAIHSELHKAYPDINAACHAHSVYGKAWSTFGKPLDMINQDVCTFYKAHTVYSDFGGVAFEAEEGKAIAKALGEKGKGAILMNHGLLTVGQTVDEAAYCFTLMERSCETQLLVEAACANGNMEKVIIGDEEAAYTYHMSADPETLYGEFQPDFEYEIAMTNGDFLN